MKYSKHKKYNIYFSQNKIKFSDEEKFINSPLFHEKNSDNYFTKQQLEYYRSIYNKNELLKEISTVSINPKK